MASLPVVMGDASLVRAVAAAGHRCAVFTRPSDPIRHSRHVVATVPWTEPWEDPEGALEALLAFAAGRQAPPVLLQQRDGDLLMLSRARERLGGAVLMSLAEPGLLERLLDKDAFQALAAELGLPVPRSVPLADASGAGLRLPVVVKPVTRSPAWTALVADAKGKARLVRSEAELAAVAREAAALGVEALAQEAIEGPETRIESYHVYVDERGEIAGEFTGRKLRTLPREFGESTAVEITDVGDVRELGRDVVLRIGLTGVAKLDFKRSADGVLHLFEVNPRFNLWHYPGAVAGVNLPALVIADLVGAPRPAVGRVRAGVTWCQPVRDVRAARAHGVPLRAWLRFLATCDAPSNLVVRDPLPFVRGLAGRATG